MSACITGSDSCIDGRSTVFDSVAFDLKSLTIMLKKTRSTTLRKYLDEELLELAGLANKVSFVRRMKKLNTDQVYRQRKFNLLHEDTEGFSKEHSGSKDSSPSNLQHRTNFIHSGDNIVFTSVTCYFT